MSGFGFGGGFGSNNNQNSSSTGFGGGFGSNNNNNTNPSGGFGSSNTTGFGSANNTTGGSLFGGSTSNTGGFGSGGFGSNNNQNSSPFGSKPAFGSTSTSSGSGGLFGGGSTTASSFGGGFGSNAANNPSSSAPFGSNTGSGSLFGQNKQAFGSAGAGNTGSSIFGGGSNAFGSNTNSNPSGAAGAFGASNSSPFASNVQAQTQNSGTGSTPFSAYTEKDAPTGSNCHYQSITFMQPYQNYSFEELRLADYAQGRRFGNTNGQSGAFGQPSGFGGFGSSNTGGFGSGSNTTGGSMFGGQQNTTSSPFGGTNQTSNTGFGSTGSTSLFGQSQNKPAGGGLFGGTTSSSQPSGGLFGTSGNTGTGFGASNTGTGFGSNTGSGGSLFGGQNQNQSKPFGSFGSTGSGFGSGTGGFGSTNNTSTGGGGFGGNNANTSSPFGGTQNQNTTTNSNPFGGFGANQNQNQNQNQPSGGSGLFGGGFGSTNNQNDQNKTGSLFGGNTNTSTGGGLFGGQNSQNQQSGGLFGGQNSQQSSTSMFGQPKPANAGGGLFGGLNTNTNNTTSTGGGLFGGLGNNQNQQTQSSSLFGGNQQQQQSKPLFGATNTNTNTGGGLFGGSGQTNQNNTGSAFGGSLFGGSQQNQQQPPPQGSLFGTSQSSFSQQPQQQQPTSLTASLSANPYGNDQLFSTLGTPQQSVGPLATPLSSAQKQRKSAILPQYKINPAATSRLLTPQKRTPMYGFSYSTYGTPGSAASNVSSPQGFPNGLLGGGSLGRSVSKSLSTSNLRNSFSVSDSILAPGAFSGSAPRSYANSGSMKRLNINRNLRTDLFNGPSNDSTPRKTVSFNNSITNGDAQPNANHSTTTNGNSSNALVRVEESESPTPSAEELGMLRSSRTSSTTPRANGTPSAPEMEQVRGNELAVVPEDESPQAVSKTASNLAIPRDRSDKRPSDYWSKPTLDELRSYSPKQLQRVAPFVVGRHGCGRVEFPEADLSKTPLDDIYDKVVVIGVRTLTVYPDQATKPPRGTALNVFSIITLENSWPRARGGKLPVHEDKGARFEKHLERLKRVNGTKFVSYNTQTGEWTFTVDHYTTYGLDYDDDDAEDVTMSGAVPSSPDSPTPGARSPARPTEETPQSQADTSMLSPDDSSPDDTFEFKKGKKAVPGGFEDDFLYEDNDVSNVQGNEMSNENSFLGERSMGSSVIDPMDDDLDELDHNEDQQMAGSFPVGGPTVDRRANAYNEPHLISPFKPKSILKAPEAAATTSDTPTRRVRAEFLADWAEQLQRTISPRKPNRGVLKESQGNLLRHMEEQDHKIASKTSLAGKGFQNSIDVMNSLFGQDNNKLAGKGTKLSASAKGFEWPYAKRTRLDDDFEQLNDNDKAYYRSFRPSWNVDDTLSYTVPPDDPKLSDGVFAQSLWPLASEDKDIRFAKPVAPSNLVPATFEEQKRFTRIGMKDGVPFAETTDNFAFKELASAFGKDSQSGIAPQQWKHEQRVWELASLLFDNVVQVSPEHLSEAQPENHELQLRKDKLQDFWQRLVEPDAHAQVNRVKQSKWASEEKAFLYLSAYDLVNACNQLIQGKDFRLATMVSLAGSGDELSRSEMAAQLQHWRDLNTLSEIPEAVRALYELLAGNTGQCEGKMRGAPEDRATTFRQSIRFKLDWRRSFGLRLWYGILQNEPLEAAISQYASDRASGKEEVRPVPWFVEQDSDASWPHYHNDDREDLLFGLLKIYAARKSDANSPLSTISLEPILAPENLSPNPLNARLSFQLACLFHARKLASFHDPTTLDTLALAHAAPLAASPTHWPNAIFTLLHLSSASARESAIRAVLTRHAAALDPTVSTPQPDTTSTFTYLVDTLRVPPAWLHDARATYARAVLRDPALEIAALVKAGRADAAHAVLCATVGPRAVVSGDLDALRESLGEFERVRDDNDHHDQGSGNEGVRVRGWEHGGGVYFDYVLAVDLAGSELPRVVPERREVLRRLVERLPGLMAGRKESVEERVAVWEMGRWVTEAVRKEEERTGGLEARNTMKLPLTEDAKLKQTMELSVDYYRALIASGR
ncbi:MAG: hypothetical protein M1822_001313 [Bathelium mastoideum]|nr:MAG: hypothetical protein M1822_001313 [Bathelium mastoideum]